MPGQPHAEHCFLFYPPNIYMIYMAKVIWWMSLEMHLTTRDNLSQWAESWILKQRRAAVKQVFGPAGNHLPPPTWTSRTWSLSWSWSDPGLPRWQLLPVLARWEGGERLATRPTCSFDLSPSLLLRSKRKGKFWISIVKECFERVSTVLPALTNLKIFALVQHFP